MTAPSRVKAFLKWKGWRIADLAREAGVDHSTISKIVKGERSAGLAVATAIEGATEGWPRGPIRVSEWLHHRTAPRSAA